jgi:solute carrier family 35 protein E1
MNAINTYAVLTLLSSVLLLPVAALLEGSVWKSTFQALGQSGQLWVYSLQTFLAALFYYTYNEVSFLCLDNVSPLSHTLANTLKRVFIILSSVLVFGNRITPRGIVGSTLAVGGVFLYSLAKEKSSSRK